MEGNGTLPKIEVTTAWSTAEIYLHGAQVTHFQKRGEEPLLFCSQLSRFETGAAIRGGVPIVLPWFGPREGQSAHGFARTVQWDLNETMALPDGGATLRFSLPETPAGGMWPSFTAIYVVTVTDRLGLELIVTNIAPDAEFTFENCLHTYFTVGDVTRVNIIGLKGATYLDKVESFAPKKDSADSIQIDRETDRHYLDTTSTVEILDSSLKRRIKIEKSGSASTVVWNPWTAKARQMPDFGDDEYKKMVCVESGNVAKNRIVLPPGKSSVVKVTLSSGGL